MILKHIIQIRFLSFLLLVMLLVHACKKEAAIHTKPVVTFISPISGEYNESDTIPVHIQIQSEDDLHEYKVEIYNVTENKTAYIYTAHTHGRSVDIRLSFLPNVSVDSKMKLTVTMLDHNGNQGEADMLFTVKNTVLSVRPVITILSPELGEYHNGEQVRFRTNITHSNPLKEVSLFLTKNGAVVFKVFPAVGGEKQFDFDTTIFVSSASHASYVFTATALGVDSLYDMQRTYFDVHP